MTLLAEARRGLLRPDAGSFVAAIGACAAGGLWQRAISLLGEMLQDGIVPTVACYSAAINVCAIDAEWMVALRLLAAAAAACGGDASIASASNAAVAACATALQWEWAMQLIQVEITEARIGEMVLTSALVACAGVAAWQQALQLMLEAERLGLYPAAAAALCASACDRAGRQRKAFRCVVRSWQAILSQENPLTAKAALQLQRWRSFTAGFVLQPLAGGDVHQALQTLLWRGICSPVVQQLQVNFLGPRAGRNAAVSHVALQATLSLGSWQAREAMVSLDLCGSAKGTLRSRPRRSSGWIS